MINDISVIRIYYMTRRTFLIQGENLRYKRKECVNMKKATKKLVAAALAALMTTSACTTFTGCKNNKNENTAPSVNMGGSLSTMYGGATESTSSADVPTPDAGENGSSLGSSSQSQSGGSVTPLPQRLNLLTGEPSASENSNIRPIAIVVDNISNAYKNQTGLDRADVLYEALVAPGITRFLMVASDYTLLDSVCNIRSGRDYHLDFAAYHNAILVCHGGSITSNYDFFSLAAERYGSRWGFIDTEFEKWFSMKEYGNLYGTVAHYGDRKDLAFDTVFKPSALTALLSSGESKFAKLGGGSLSGKTKESLYFVNYGTKKDLSGASAATKIDLVFQCENSSNVKNVSYTYSAAAGKYLRSQDGKAHVDAQTGEQLAFTNVVTLFTEVRAVNTGISSDPVMTVMETEPGGSKGYGYYFTEGRVIEIRWSADGNSLRLEETDGSVLRMNTGNTYIGYLDSAYLADGPFWN